MNMQGLGRLGKFGGGSFGEDCPPGYYRLKVFGVDTGQCLPSLDTAVSAAQGGVLSSVGTGVASSSATQQAATNAAGAALGTKIITFYKEKPVLAIGGTLAVAALVLAGLGVVRIPGLSR